MHGPFVSTNNLLLVHGTLSQDPSARGPKLTTHTLNQSSPLPLHFTSYTQYLVWPLCKTFMEGIFPIIIYGLGSHGSESLSDFLPKSFIQQEPKPDLKQSKCLGLSDSFRRKNCSSLKPTELCKWLHHQNASPLLTYVIVACGTPSPWGSVFLGYHN